MSRDKDEKLKTALEPTHEDLRAQLAGPYIVNLLFRGYRNFQELMQRRLQARGHLGIGLAETRLLLSLDPEGTRIVTLAERTETTKQFTGRVVQELEQRGYVTTTIDPDDHRAIRVKLAPQGLQYLLDIKDVKRHLDTTLLDILGEEHVPLFVSALQQLIEGTEREADSTLDQK